MQKIQRLAITSGEPAGIGPELIVKISQQDNRHQLVVIGDPNLLKQRAQLLGLPLNVDIFNPDLAATPSKAGHVLVQPITLATTAVAGQLDKNNAAYVIETLKQAALGCMEKTFNAMVTPPVHKGIINSAGIPFTGHTEYLQQLTGVDKVVMMLAHADMRVALMTTHLPLSEVSSAITRETIHKVTRILHSDLQDVFGIENPNILVTGLNPHAGEDGHMGREEIDTIIPAIDELRQEGISLKGPLPADTLFTEKYLKHCDAVLAMYHDQGLPVLKYSGFGKAVNITLGLPIIRTSVDHGTAVDIAEYGIADTGSFNVAIDYAIELAEQSQLKKG